MAGQKDGAAAGAPVAGSSAAAELRPGAQQAGAQDREHQQADTTQTDRPTNDWHIEKRLERWINSVGTVTLPLLAGFAVTSVVVVSDDPEKFRWPGLTILALAVAALALIVAVQCAYHAHVYLGNNDPNHDRGLTWARRTRRFYDLGLLAALVSLALVVVPRGAASVENDYRWAATILAGGACAAEILWLRVDPWLRTKRRTWFFQRSRADR
jgi:hypothetical protein